MCVFLNKSLFFVFFRSIVEYAKQFASINYKIDDFVVIPGCGVSCLANGDRVYIGTREWLKQVR